MTKVFLATDDNRTLIQQNLRRMSQPHVVVFDSNETGYCGENVVVIPQTATRDEALCVLGSIGFDPSDCLMVEPSSDANAALPYLESTPLSVQQGRTYDGFRHRTGWPVIAKALRKGEWSAVLDDFVEATFGWKNPPQPVYREPWVGIAHNPKGQHPALSCLKKPAWTFRKSSAWALSEPSLKTLIVLSEHHRQQLGRTEVPVEVLRHPITTEHPSWSLDAFDDRPRFLQVGEWMRNPNLLYQVPIEGRTIIQRNSFFSKSCRAFIEDVSGKQKFAPGYEELGHVSNERYDTLFSSSVIVSEFYDASANNVVVETIARATPHLVNEHPAVIEYLGSDYPLTFLHKSDIPKILKDRGRIVAAHECLLERRKAEWLSIPFFVDRVEQIVKSCT